MTKANFEAQAAAANKQSLASFRARPDLKVVKCDDCDDGWKIEYVVVDPA